MRFVDLGVSVDQDVLVDLGVILIIQDCTSLELSLKTTLCSCHCGSPNGTAFLVKTAVHGRGRGGSTGMHRIGGWLGSCSVKANFHQGACIPQGRRQEARP